MKPLAKQLYLFLSACGGNWRNTIFVSYPESDPIPGVLMAVDRDGCPVIMELESFYQMTGEQIDPAECYGQLSKDAFESVFAQYLLWHTNQT